MNPVSRKVTLWPEDEDWFCDCGTTQAVCAHVAAAVITLKNPKPHSESAPSGEAEKPKASLISYRFRRDSGKLLFDRWIIHPDGKESPLSQSLVSLVGGLSSGRIGFFPIAATQEDYAIDSVLGGTLRGELDHSPSRLIKALSGCSNITLDEQIVQASTKPLQIRARLLNEGSGYRLQQIPQETETEYFKNGAALCGNQLRGVDLPNLTADERSLLSESGRYFPRSDAVTLFTTILPTLEKRSRSKINARGSRSSFRLLLESCFSWKKVTTARR